ncbi:histidine kinase [Bacillus sp. DX1.1]|nr:MULTISPECIES: histidine kinase [unclassified Bacillus (in: firmicutes)]MDM5153244.1 histidine kinase [Bacillus sp. DX1.1]WJE82207.1 histidine kinase [Bacillus sp. DX3.1]
MKKTPKVKNKGEIALFLIAAGAVVIVKFAFKVGIIHTIRMWFENIF